MTEQKNEVTITGIVARTPRVTETHTGGLVSKFRVRTDVPRTSFIPVMAWNDMAEKTANLKEGDTVTIKGHIATGSFKGQNGDTVYTFEVSAEEVDLGNEEKKSSVRRSKPVPI
jgi:single-stranded DNA-binding protein